MFDGVIISDTARSALCLAAADRRLPHTVILEGTDAENRMKAALSVAQAAVCSSVRPPCGECSHCVKTAQHCHPDVAVLEKPDKKANYAVDDIRKLKTDAYIIPGEADRKVYILSEAQYLTVACQNMLLKLIEEPPTHAMFIFTCPSASYLLGTVRSRAPTFYLGETADESENEAAEELSLKLAGLLAKGSEADFMEQTAAFEKDKTLYIGVLDGLESCLRDAVVCKSGGSIFLSDGQTAKSLASVFTAEVLMRMLDTLRTLSDEAQYNINQNLAVTRLCSALFGAKQI